MIGQTEQPTTVHADTGATIALPAAPLLQTWGRRALTIPLYTLLNILVVGTLPLLLLIAAAFDVCRKRGLVVVRCVAFLALYLCCETIGILASAMLWLGVRGRERSLQRHYALQQWWAGALLGGAQRIFGMRIEVEGAEVAARGPMLLFSRHASLGDSLLPSVFIARRYSIRLRYVLKRELLWDPCLDIVGHRLPNYFVQRGSGESARGIAAIQALAEDLRTCDGVLIFPEGTRFTPAKRARLLQRLQTDADPTLLERAQALMHVLPPRLGGPLGLLERNQNADAVFCAHVGFEGSGSARELLSGALVGAVIRVGFWRVPFAQIPAGRAAQADWLFEQWRRVDDWIGRHQ
ncbi:MAG TPA: lysophospholipid acyltransferase family protein [Candidatus Kryptonia bacterium]|nr:lysophospholipid acyltransferase family protein [Candidatus Kryptonia bacterium]